MSDDATAAGAAEQTATTDGAASAAPSDSQTQDQGQKPAPGTAPAAPKAAATEAKPADPAAWRATVREELRDTAGRFASVNDALEAVQNLRKDISSRVKLPGKDAKPEDIAAFRNAIGAPKDAAEYFPAVEGVELNETDKLVQGKVAEVLHRYHVPASAAGELNAVVSEIAANFGAEQERLATEGRAQAEAQLQREWGPDYEANKQVAIRAARTFGDQALADFLSTTHVDGVKLGDHPMLVKAFAKIGRRMGEGGFMDVVSSDERGSLEQQLSELTREMLNAHDSGDRMKAQEIDKRRGDIARRLTGGQPIVGRQGRSA